MKLFYSLVGLFLCLSAQAQSPHLTGVVELNRSNGTFKCALTVSRIPNSGRYEMWLNTGMNIQWIKDNDTGQMLLLDKVYEPEESFECFQYSFSDSLAPHSLTLQYCGAFPVVKETDSKYDWEDWMGAIAVNEQSIRASNQSAWHPIIFTLQDSLLKDKMTYDLEFKCEDFNSIYLSGSLPKTRSLAQKDTSDPQPIFTTRVSTSTPVHLMLFAGIYDVHESAHLNLINSSLSKNQMEELDKTVQDIIRHYETWLNIDYGQNLTFIETNTISEKSGFSFFSYPTITYVECPFWGMESMFDDTSGLLNPNQIAFIAHEIAHYYIGTLVQPKGELFWFINEGLTEFIALNYVETHLTIGQYNTRIAGYVSRAEQMSNQFIPLCEIDQKSQLDYDNFRYNYAPLVFAQMQKEFGVQTMTKWIENVLNGTSAIAQMSDFEQSLLAVQISEKQTQGFIDKYLCGASSFQQLISSWKK